MPRSKKPQPSKALSYLRLVMKQDWAQDDKKDVELGHYRKMMNDDPKWVHQQRSIAEKEYADAVAAWEEEQERGQATSTNDPCDVVLEKLLNEWDSLKV